MQGASCDSCVWLHVTRDSRAGHTRRQRNDSRMATISVIITALDAVVSQKPCQWARRRNAASAASCGDADCGAACNIRNEGPSETPASSAGWDAVTSVLVIPYGRWQLLWTFRGPFAWTRLTPEFRIPSISCESVGPPRLPTCASVALHCSHISVRISLGRSKQTSAPLPTQPLVDGAAIVPGCRRAEMDCRPDAAHEATSRSRT